MTDTLVNFSSYFLSQSRSIMYDRRRKKYGLLKFCLDAILTIITGGFWLIWIFVREMRQR